MEQRKVLILGNPHTHPSSKAFLEKFINITKNVWDEIYVISGDSPPSYNNVTWVCIGYQGHRDRPNVIAFLKSQLRILHLLKRYAPKYETAIILPTTFVLPTLFLKIMGKRVALFVDGKPQNKILVLFAKIDFMLSDALAIESKNVLREWRIEKYHWKSVEASIYVDTTMFNIKKRVHKRRRIVGFVGRLSPEKGILEFVKAIPLVLQQERDLEFWIVGDGPLKPKVEEYLKTMDIADKVKLIGWISHNELPRYLNELKLLVLPSKTEGLPNIVLEAMACGTPVITTPVGALPDIITNNKTGIIIADNSPESISKGIITALTYLRLHKISKNERGLIESRYSYAGAVRRYKKLFNFFPVCISRS